MDSQPDSSPLSSRKRSIPKYHFPVAVDPDQLCLDCRPWEKSPLQVPCKFLKEARERNSKLRKSSRKNKECPDSVYDATNEETPKKAAPGSGTPKRKGFNRDPSTPFTPVRKRLFEEQNSDEESNGEYLQYVKKSESPIAKRSRHDSVGSIESSTESRASTDTMDSSTLLSMMRASINKQFTESQQTIARILNL